MLKWMVSVVLATKKYRTREEVFSAFCGQQDGTKVATTASNMNMTSFTRKDAILVVLCAMVLIQAVAIIFLITKMM